MSDVDDDRSLSPHESGIPTELVYLIAGAVVVNIALSIALLVRKNATGMGIVEMETGDDPLNTEDCVELLANELILSEKEWQQKQTAHANGVWESEDGNDWEDVKSCGEKVSAESAWLTALTVRLATTTSNMDYASEPFIAGKKIDGVTLALGDRILIKDQATRAHNGIYTVNSAGNPTRAADMAALSDAAGTVIYVQEGVVNAGKEFETTDDLEFVEAMMDEAAKKPAKEEGDKKAAEEKADKQAREDFNKKAMQRRQGALQEAADKAQKREKEREKREKEREQGRKAGQFGLMDKVKIKPDALKALKTKTKYADLDSKAFVVGVDGKGLNELTIPVTYGTVYVDGVKDADLEIADKGKCSTSGFKDKCAEMAALGKNEAKEQMKEANFNTWYGAALNGRPVFDMTTTGALVAVVAVIGGAMYALSQQQGGPGTQEEAGVPAATDTAAQQ